METTQPFGKRRRDLRHRKRRLGTSSGPVLYRGALGGLALWGWAFLAWALGGLLAAGPALANPAGLRVQASLTAESGSIAPGGQTWVAVRLEVATGWHVYWRNPGDSGLPPSLRWTLPEGIAVGAPLFPVPARIPLEPLVDYGYRGEVILLVPITVETTVTGNSVLRLEADAEWLVCREQCVPESTRLTLALTIAGDRAGDLAGTTAGDSDATTALFARARSRLPVARGWPANYTIADGQLKLRVGLSAAGRGGYPSGPVWFFPFEDGRLDHAAAQALHQDADSLTLTTIPGNRLAAGQPAAGSLEGLLVFFPPNPAGRKPEPLLQDPPDGTVGVELVALPTATLPNAAGGSGDKDQAADRATDWATALTALGPAIAGGLLLNAMPCVFPVLMLKVLGLIKVAHSSRRRAAIHGLAFSAGVILSFLLVALVLLALRSAGALVGWGFQLQSPLLVLGLAWIFFAVGLSLSGLFALGHRLANVGTTLAAAPGTAGSFFGGVLATVVATPCTAPFMGAAIGVAVTLSPLPALTVFAALGFGMALPFLAVSLFPGVRSCLPRPGPWMVRFKEALAFPMYASALWLIWVLSQQRGLPAVMSALEGGLLIAGAGWIYEATRHASRGWRLIGLGLIAAALLGLGGLVHEVEQAGAPEAGMRPVASGDPDTPRPDTPRPDTPTLPASGIAWQSYTPEALAAALAAGQPVFLDFTAAWCLTCLVNERLVLSRSAVAAAFQASRITAFRGDWTRHEPAITEALAHYGRNGVPLYVFYPARPTGVPAVPVILPQFLSESILLETLGVRSGG